MVYIPSGTEMCISELTPLFPTLYTEARKVDASPCASLPHPLHLVVLLGKSPHLAIDSFTHP